MMINHIREPNSHALHVEPANIEPAFSDQVIGLDLVGIGDFFGPIVVVGASIGQEDVNQLEGFGVSIPSKWTPKVAFQGISKVYRTIPKRQAFSIVISPRRYNEMLQSMSGRNRVIAWAHAQCIERLVADGRRPGAVVASDFGDLVWLRSRLRREGHDLGLQQMAHAEREPAVTAASFISHARLFQARRRMDRKYGMRFPPGARNVIGAGRIVLARYGPETLREVAKADFRTFGELLRHEEQESV